MSLKHILLGLLRDPQTGYDLKRAFDDTLRHFWSAELSQIYPSLQRMESEGLMASATQPPSKGPARRVYHRTPQGLDELHTWLRKSPVPVQPRVGHLAQIYFQGELGDLTKTRVLFQELLQSFRRQLAALEAIERRMQEEQTQLQETRDPDVINPHLTLRYGIHRLSANVAWCEESLTRIDALLADKGNQGGNSDAP